MNFKEQLVDVVHTIVCTSGKNENFDAKAWVEDWLDHPLPALGFKKPNEFMDTDDGRAEINRLLQASAAGVYQ